MLYGSKFKALTPKELAVMLIVLTSCSLTFLTGFVFLTIKLFETVPLGVISDVSWALFITGMGFFAGVQLAKSRKGE